MKETDLNNALVDMITPIADPLGFEKQEGGDGLLFRRITAFGFNDISLLTWLYGDVSYVSLAFAIRIDQLNKIFIPYGAYVIHEKDETITLGANIQTFGCEGDNKIEVKNEEELLRALKILQKILVEKALPFFDQFSSVASVDEELNGENRHKNLYCHEIIHQPFIGITAAALNNNKNFKYLEKFYRDKLKNDTPRAREKYEALVMHLKLNMQG